MYCLQSSGSSFWSSSHGQSVVSVPVSMSVVYHLKCALNQLNNSTKCFSKVWSCAMKLLSTWKKAKPAGNCLKRDGFMVLWWIHVFYRQLGHFIFIRQYIFMRVITVIRWWCQWRLFRLFMIDWSKLDVVAFFLWYSKNYGYISLIFVYQIIFLVTYIFYITTIF